MAENKVLLQGPFVSMAAGLSRESSLEGERDLTWKGRAAGAGDLGEQPWSLSASRASRLEPLPPLPSIRMPSFQSGVPSTDGG